MPDPLSLDNDVLSFTPGNPMLTAQSSAPPPPPAPAGRDYGPEITQNRAAADAEIAKVQKAQDAEIAAMQEKAKAQQPFIDKALEQSQQPLPARPKRETPPPVPQRQSQHEDEQWLFASALLGSLAGALTRRHQTNALAAFSGAMEGYNEGSKQKFDQNMRTWEAENKRALETNKQAMDEYRDILEDRKLSAEQMFTAIKLAGLKNGDQAAIEVAKQQNGELLAKYYDKRADAALKAQESADKLLAQEARAKERDQAAKQAKMEEAARLYVASEEGQKRIEQTMKLLRPPPSQAVPRNTEMGLREAMIADALSARGLDFGAFKRNANVKNIEETTPAMATRAGETSKQRVQANREAQLELIISTTDSLLPRAAASASAIPATNFPSINKLMSMADEQIGNPALIRLKIDTLAVEEGWARSMNPTGQMTVNNVNRAHSVMAGAYTPETYIAALDELHGLLSNEQQAIQRVRRGETLTPLEIPQLKSGSLGNATGALAGRAAGAVETAGVPKGMGLPPGAAGRQRGPMSPTPDMPIIAPTGRTPLPPGMPKELEQLYNQGYSITPQP